MLPNIVLIGFMGCGKSSVGRRLAGLTGHRFLDTDDLIAQAEGRSIPEIFAAEGESYFRDVEHRVLSEQVGTCGLVLSTGGGLVLRQENREILRRLGVVAWLDADREALLERATRTGKRPLLQTENPRETFFRLLEERLSVYREVADFRVDSTNLSHDEAAQSLLDGALREGRRFEY